MNRFRQLFMSLAIALIYCACLVLPVQADIRSEARVTGSVPSGTSVVSTPVQTNVITAVPTLNLTAAGSALVTAASPGGETRPGDEYRLLISVENTGISSVSNPELTAILDRDGNTLAFDAAPVLQGGDLDGSGTLDRGETWQWLVVRTLLQDDIDQGGVLVGTGTFTGTSISGPANEIAFASASVVQSLQLSFAKTAISTGFSQNGETVSWALVVENIGNVTASNISLADTISNAISCPSSTADTIASLLPGQTETCQVDYPVKAPDIAAGSINNFAEVSTTFLGAPYTLNASSSINLHSADLTSVLALVSGNPNPQVGETVQFSITLSNNGPSDAVNINLQALLPESITADVINGQVTGGVYDAQTGLWTISDLANGANVVLTLSGVVNDQVREANGVIAIVASSATSDFIDPTAVGDELSLSLQTPAVVAVDDTLEDAVDASADLVGFMSVLSNDSISGIAAGQANVSISVPAPLPDGITLNPDGTLDVAAFTEPGTYRFDYQICSIVTPLDCDIAEVTFEVILTFPKIEGVLFSDVDGDGNPDAGEPIFAGYTIRLTDSDGNVVAEALSEPDGSYELSNFEPGDYTMLILDENDRAVVAEIPISADRSLIVAEQNIPIDPSGVVYDSLTSDLISGVTVQMFNANSNLLLPNVCLLAGQQTQTTGADGFYRFDVVPGAAVSCPSARTRYRLEFTSPSGFEQGISTIRPPQSGALNAATCPVDATAAPSCGVSANGNPPAPGAAGTYFLEFELASGDPDVVFNHVPLDATASLSTSGIQLVKRANLDGIVRGQSIRFELEASNTGSVPIGSISIEDDLPGGISFVAGSATLDGSAIPVQIDGRQITFGTFSLDPDQSRTVSFMARSGLNSPLGRYTNKARIVASNGNRLTADALASFLIEPEAIFDCSEVIGRVFEDRNRNGIVDEGERGVSNVKLATANGIIITVDDFGRFSIPCAALPDGNIGSNFVLKLDEQTLPTGYNVVTDNPKVARLTAGKATRMNFGVSQIRVVKLDLSATAFLNERSEMSSALENGVIQLSRSIGGDPFILELNYRRQNESLSLVRERLRGLEDRLRELLRIKPSDEVMKVRSRITRN